MDFLYQKSRIKWDFSGIIHFVHNIIMETSAFFKNRATYDKISHEEINGVFVMSYNDLFQIDATLVANEFLDKYMPSANGDYVKVYLYLLRNRVSGIDVETIADQLELTEGDVRRAIRYWEKCGIVSVGSGGTETGSAAQEDTVSAKISGNSTETGKTEAKISQGPAARSRVSKAGPAKSVSNAAAPAKNSEDPQPAGADDDGEIRSRYRRTDGREALNRLSEDDEFRQLLVIVQKYRAKILTEADQQVLAYLYDGLHLPCDVLDYLVQYCVENNHMSMRYIEKTGLDWASRGIRTVREAKERTKQFDKPKEESARRKNAKKDAAGITRGRDLDQWLSQVVQRKIQ